MAPASSEPPLGAIVEVPAGRGVVRFCGATSFAPGRWIGIELSQPNGKNDGTVQGVKYFTCKPNYGVFVRPSQVKVISATPEPAVSARPSSVLKRYQHLKSLQSQEPSVTSARAACQGLRPSEPFPSLRLPALRVRLSLLAIVAVSSLLVVLPLLVSVRLRNAHPLPSKAARSPALVPSRPMRLVLPHGMLVYLNHQP